MNRLPIYVEGDLVGALSVREKIHGRAFFVRFPPTLEGAAGSAPSFEGVMIPLSHRYVEVDKRMAGVTSMSREIAITDALARAGYEWPDVKLEETYEALRDTSRFSWIVGEVERATAETLFDLDEFEPWGRPDAAVAVEEAWWDRHGRRFHSGGIIEDSVTISAASIAIGTITGKSIAAGTVKASKLIDPLSEGPLRGISADLFSMDELKTDWATTAKAFNSGVSHSFEINAAAAREDRIGDLMRRQMDKMMAQAMKGAMSKAVDDLLGPTFREEAIKEAIVSPARRGGKTEMALGAAISGCLTREQARRQALHRLATTAAAGN